MSWDPGSNTGKVTRDDGTIVNSANALISKAIVAGTKSCTTAAAVVAADQACVEVILQNDPANLVNILIGDATSQPIVLTIGMHIVLPISNVNLVYAKSASSTATLNWLART